jgi:Metallo-beta-lactamase superfamily
VHFGHDLPLPELGALSIYVLGGGVGESVVVVFPDGRILVMDACTHDGFNLPLSLLRHLGRTKIDLLIVSHPDLDHVRGLAELIEGFDPTDVWRYPFDGVLREYAAKWCRSKGQQELAEAVEALDRHGNRTGRVAQSAYGSRPWPPAHTTYEVHALAPTHYDQQRARRVWGRLVTFEKGQMRASRWLERMLHDRPFPKIDAPNVVSLAVSIVWSSKRVLLGGDVLRGTKSQHSGWKGILKLLDADDLGHMVNDLTVVKLSHHGSHTGFAVAAWDRHANLTRPVGLITPFSPSHLPDQSTLGGLLPHASKLLVSSKAGGVETRISAAGWTLDSPSLAGSTSVPCIAVMLPTQGDTRFFVSAPAISASHPSTTPTARP